VEQIEQLKTIRDAARARIEASADYKLVTSLGRLIAELEEVMGVTSESGAGDDAEGGEEEPSSGLAMAGGAENAAGTDPDWLSSVEQEVTADIGEPHEGDLHTDEIAFAEDVASREDATAGTNGQDSAPSAIEITDEAAAELEQSLAAEAGLVVPEPLSVETPQPDAGLAEADLIPEFDEAALAAELSAEIAPSAEKTPTPDPDSEEAAINQAIAELEADLENVTAFDEPRGRRRS
jgi:hypothetical protein